MTRKNAKNRDQLKAAESPPSTILDGDVNSEMAQKFELELCWCIQQLQISLKGGKLTPKQAHEHTKTMHSLMSSTSSIIKKRQLMKLTFGDYRGKMAQEELKFQSRLGSSRFKLQCAAQPEKSVFIKKSLFSTSGNSFQFKFPSECEEDSLPDISSAKSERIPMYDGFIPSDNSFKFNFTAEKDTTPES